ncbi:hypothetical protein L210DRAFT_2791200 [Boletus edulis BED1]|uniref:Uncharacterized protein n=1 Tax=Boletus edulis BED1 TaxID=1328754 RepID=A0AAD4C459_BOLED|nr:hypothetical protein L210DRAFT_2791200 [Boletus edulis BED1]
MQSFPIFFRIRAITFVIIMLFSFLWLVLLSVEIFARWTMSDRISQSLMILFILANTATLILLPILLLVEFRTWLDAARLFLLFILQVGSAAAGACWSPRIQCPDQNLDDIGVCQLISVYTLIASWIIPAMLLLYSSYFSAVVYLQSRIPVVVEPKRRSGVDREMGSSDGLSTWKEMLKGIVGIQGSGTDTSVPPRPLMLPTVHTGQTSPSLPSPQGQSTLPNPPHRQSRMSSLPHTSSQQPLPTSHSVSSRHHSLPAFKHGNVPHIRPSLTLPIPHVLASNPPSSHPQTPSSHSYSTPSSANHSFTFRPGVANVQSPIDHRWRSKHLSMMPPSSSSPREMQSPEGSPTTRSMRAKLTKPLPAHLL